MTRLTNQREVEYEGALRALPLIAVLGVVTMMFSDAYFATCTGSDPCSACKELQYCKHCAKEGGNAASASEAESSPTKQIEIVLSGRTDYRSSLTGMSLTAAVRLPVAGSLEDSLEEPPGCPDVCDANSVVL